MISLASSGGKDRRILLGLWMDHVSAVTSHHNVSGISAAGFVLGLGGIISCSGELFSQRDLCVGAVLCGDVICLVFPPSFVLFLGGMVLLFREVEADEKKEKT